METSAEIKTKEWSEARSVLLCPRCGSSVIGHGQVRIFDRREDAVEVLLTKVNGNRTVTETMPHDTSDNPSSRRDGLIIDFHCEECGGTAALLIAQHKGSTEIGWRW
jgi:predicted RNA-binding Zn-ribbon protein involved in translation (DUF1610 family)